MENDLEDGEVLDSDNEEGSANKATSAVLPTGIKNAASSFSWRADQAFTGFNAEPVAATKPQHRPTVQKLRKDSSDSESSNEASDSDSDAGPSAKKKCTMSPSSMPPCVQPTAAKPSKYNIWGSVIQEQTLAKDLGGWFGVKTKVQSDRDVETYDYRNAKKDIGADDDAAASADITDVVDVPQDTPATDEGFDICDRETFGTNSTASSARKRKRNSDVDRSLDDIISRKRSGGGMAATAGYGRRPVQSRLSKRTFDKDKDRSHVQVSVDDAPTVVGEELVRVLGEPEHMKATFVRVAETLGAEKALDLLYCTEDLEAAGGLMTLDESRRRTPGGIYLFLVKDTADVTRAQQDVIFFGSSEERRRQQRNTKRQRWKVHENKISAAMSAGPFGDDGDLPTLPDRKDVFLAGAPNGDGGGEVKSPSQPAAVEESHEMRAAEDDVGVDDVGVDDVDAGIDDYDGGVLSIELDLD